MSDSIALDLTKDDGHIVQHRVPISATEISVRFFLVSVRRLTAPPVAQLGDRQLAGVSDNIVQLTRVTSLRVRHVCVSCQFVDAVGAALRQRPLRDPSQRVDNDAPEAIDREPPLRIRSLLTPELAQLHHNRLVAIPREIGRLTALIQLWVSRHLPPLHRLTFWPGRREPPRHGAA